MSNCRWSSKVERWFDGESPQAEAVVRHVAECPDCSGHIAQLNRVRSGIKAVAVRQEVGQGQFPAFMEGIRQGVERPARRHTGIWTLASLTAAALLVAVSIFAVFTGPQPAKAHTEVESAATEVEGATVKTQNSSDTDPAIVWVHVPRKDVL